MNKGIPTEYAITKFRSRLEARWAAFFDLLGWRAFYEPLDLDGYIPDFILHGHSQRILVEVKPVKGKDDPLFKETTAKIERSGWQNDALIVSYFLPVSEVFKENPCVGWLGEHLDNAFCWDLAPFNDQSGSLGFNHEYQWYGDRITGHYSGSSGLIFPGSSAELIEKYWREAGNTVQWMKI
jgi:hypothetical protein